MVGIPPDKGTDVTDGNNDPLHHHPHRHGQVTLSHALFYVLSM